MTLGALLAKVRLYGYNGATWDRLNTAVLQNTAMALGGLRIQAGLHITDSSGNWTRVVGDPATDGSSAVGVMSTKMMSWNGTTLDRWRSNLSATLLASAVRAATTPTPDQVNYNGRAVYVRLKVTVNPGGAETLTLAVEWKPTSGDYLTLATSGVLFAAGGTGDYVILIGADTAAAANDIDQTQAYPMPRSWRANVTHSAAGNWTYLVEAGVLV